MSKSFYGQNIPSLNIHKPSLGSCDRQTDKQNINIDATFSSLPD